MSAVTAPRATVTSSLDPDRPDTKRLPGAAQGERSWWAPRNRRAMLLAALVTFALLAAALIIALLYAALVFDSGVFA